MPPWFVSSSTDASDLKTTAPSPFAKLEKQLSQDRSRARYIGDLVFDDNCAFDLAATGWGEWRPYGIQVFSFSSNLLEELQPLGLWAGCPMLK